MDDSRSIYAFAHLSFVVDCRYLNLYTNRISVIKIQCCLDKPLPTFKQFSFYFHFTHFLSKSIMPFQPSFSKKEYSNNTARIILVLFEPSPSYLQMAKQVRVCWQSFVYFIHHTTCNQIECYRLTKLACRLFKLNHWVRQVEICHLEQNIFDNLIAFGISF